MGLYWCAAALAGMKDMETQRGRGTGYRSLTSLKSISWQLAGGKLAISNHQVPDHFTHIFPKKKKKELFFSICSAVVSTGLGTLRNRQGLPRGAAALEKSGLTWATSDLYPHGHRALREASE